MPIDIENDDLTTALKKLKARENVLKQLEAISGLGSWEVDLITHKSLWSDRSYEIYKVDKEAESVELNTFFSMLLPEYHTEAKQLLQELMHTGKPLSYPCQIQRRDGQIRTIIINGQVIYNDAGEAIKLIGTTQDITDINKLQEHAKELSDLLEHSSNEIYIVALDTLEYLYVNQGACEALGYTKEELLTMNIRDVNPYLKEDEINELRTLLFKTKKTLNRTMHKRKDGSLYHAQSYIHTLNYHGKEAYVIFDIDISATIELELEYKKQARVLEHIHEAVISTDLHGNITSWNKGSENLFGYTFAQIKLKPIHTLYAKDNEHSIFDLFRQLKVNEKIEIEAWMIDANDKKIICDISLSLILNSDGIKEGYIGYIQDITKEKETQKLLEEQAQKLQYQAHHDVLTSLPNRTLFHERLSQAIITSKRNKEEFALLFIDLDQFKKINDSLGHQIGDSVLIEASKRLRSCIREQDTLARLGGDEFTIILKNVKSPKNAAKISQKIIDKIKQTMDIDGHKLHISSSIGISIYPEDTTDEADLIKYADTAMYKAKENGRDNYQFYSAEMTHQALQRVELENNLRIAIKEQQFVVYFQPQYEINSKKIIGMEALVRWLHPKDGLISPFKFIPFAEETGLIIQIDEIVMQQSMQQFVTWYKEGLAPGRLSLNLSMKQLAKDDFVEKLITTMQKLHFNPQWLELEVTEGEVMRNPDASIEKLVAINKLGVEIAIDDFGTGYSSLSYLKRLPLDKLKIDQSFIRDLSHDEDDRAITKAIIALGESLNLKLIAEGVETNEQKEFLSQNNCSYVQGYLFAKPLPSQEILPLLG